MPRKAAGTTRTRTGADATRPPPGSPDIRVGEITGSIPVGVAHCDRDLRCLSVTEGHTVLFGAGPGAALGRTVAEIPGGAGMRTAIEQHASRALAGELTTLEIATRLDSGKEIIKYLRFVPIRAANGEIPGLLIIDLDATERRSLELAVQASERHLRSMIALEPECVKLLSQRGELLEMNPAGLKMLEVDSMDELKGVALLEFVAPEYRARFSDLHRKVMQGGSGVLEFAAIGRRGTRRWLETHAVPYMDEEGRIAGLLGVTRDITETRKAKQQLESREQQLARLITNLPGFVYRCRNDISYFAEFVSEGVAELTGHPVEAFRENRLRFGDLVHPDDAESVWTEIQRALQEDRSFELTYRIRAASGAIRWVWEKGVGIKDEAGTVRALEGFVTDITDQRAAHSALLQREALLSSIYQAVGDSIFYLTIEGEGAYRFSSVNHAFLSVTGLGHDDIVGKRVDEVIPQPSLALVLDRYAQAIRTGEPVRWEETSIYPAGPLVGEVNISPVFDESGECTHLVGSVRDIAGRKAAEVAAREANERLQSLSRRLLDIREVERRQLANELHDELGQSLTAAKINLQSFQRFRHDSHSDDSRLDESIRLVEEALQQVRSLSLELRPPMLDDLGLVAAVRWLADQHGRRSGLDVTFTGNLLDRRVDAAAEIACFRVAQEALNNVVKHSAGRTVSIDLRTDDRLLHLVVRDDGIGFDVNRARYLAVRGASMGLLGMEERAALTGGGIEWRSGAGPGTEVHAWFALNPSPVPRHDATVSA